MLDLKNLSTQLVKGEKLDFSPRALLEVTSRAVAAEQGLNQALAAGLELSREVVLLEMEVATLKRHLAYSETRRGSPTTKFQNPLAGQVSGLLSQVRAMDEDRKALRNDYDAVVEVLRGELAAERAIQICGCGRRECDR